MLNNHLNVFKIMWFRMWHRQSSSAGINRHTHIHSDKDNLYPLTHCEINCILRLCRGCRATFGIHFSLPLCSNPLYSVARICWLVGCDLFYYCAMLMARLICRPLDLVALLLDVAHWIGTTTMFMMQLLLPSSLLIIGPLAIYIIYLGYITTW